jgi:hypothetical protein
MRAKFSLCVFLAAVAPGLSAQAARDWRPAERVVIGDWTRIRAMAAAPDRVFIVSPDAVLVWSPLYHRWEGPYGPPMAGVLDQVTAGMIDPLDNSLWMSTYDGWIHFQPDIRSWEAGKAGGRLLDFAFDLDAPTAGLFLRTSEGWFRVARNATVPLPSSPPVRPMRPATVAQALAANPALRGTTSTFLLDPSLRSARLTSAARSFDNLGWYLGTDGVGALFVPDGAMIPQRLTFGLPGSVVGAVTSVPGGVWVMTDRDSTSPPSLDFVPSELTDFQAYTGPPATGLPFAQGRRIIGVGSSLWAATDAGVLRFNASDPTQFRRYAEAEGLPDRRTSSVASRHGIVVAATARGLGRFVDSTGAERLAPDYAGSVAAVVIGGDTAWVGTPAGPRAAVPESGALLRPAALDESAALNRPVYDLAWVADTLVGVTSDQLFWKAPGEDRWVMGATISGILGSLHRVVPDADGVWVAGDLGVGWTRLTGAPVQPLLVDVDLPGRPLDLAVDAEYLWVATTHGLVRFQLSAARP